MSSQSNTNAKNSLGEIIVVGQEIFGKWSRPNIAKGIVKSLGKCKVKITLTEDFTKTVVKGMDIGIYFQNTWTGNPLPPDGWEDSFKWKHTNPANKGTRSKQKQKITLLPEELPEKLEFSHNEIIIALQYIKQNNIAEWLPEEDENGVSQIYKKLKDARKEKYNAVIAENEKKALKSKEIKKEEQDYMAKCLAEFRAKKTENVCEITDEKVEEIVEEEVKKVKKKRKKKGQKE